MDMRYVDCGTRIRVSAFFIVRIVVTIVVARVRMTVRFQMTVPMRSVADYVRMAVTGRDRTTT